MQSKINSQYFTEFNRKGSIPRNCLRLLIPALLITNLSNLLLSTVDGIVVGNFVGADGLSAITYFRPFMEVVGALTTVVASGFGLSYSDALGKNNQEDLKKCVNTGIVLVLLTMLALTVLQGPLSNLMINSYDLTSNQYAYIWDYAPGIMFAHVVGMISITGTYFFVASGKVKILAKLSVIEGVVNLVLDLLLTGAFSLGVAGSGWGTGISNLVRASLTFWYINKELHIIHIPQKIDWSSFQKMLSKGIPDGVDALLPAIQTLVMTGFIQETLGQDGILSKSITAFLMSLFLVFASGINQAFGSVLGLLKGARDEQGVNILMRQALRIGCIFTMTMIVIIFIYPSIPFWIHGMLSVSDVCYKIVRIYLIFLLPNFINRILRTYFVYYDNKRISVLSSILERTILPLVTSIFFRKLGINVFVSYPVASFLVLLFDLLVFLKVRTQNYQLSGYEKNFFIEVTPEQAGQISEKLSDLFTQFDLDSRFRNKISLVSEEIIAAIRSRKPALTVDTDFGVRFSKDRAVVILIDNGQRAQYEERKITGLTTDGHEIIKRLASSVFYNYVMNCNYWMIVVERDEAITEKE